MTLQIVTIALIGGIFCLDRIYAQTLISRPVVTGALLGLILGDFRTGLIIGAILELIWIDQAPIGTMVPPNDTVSTILITACTILAGNHLGALSRELIAFSIFVLCPSAILAQHLDIFIFRNNDGLARIALSCAMRGDIRGVERQHLFALLKAFVLSVLLILVLLVAGYYILIGVYPVLTVQLMKALNYIYYFIPILGVAVALNTINLERTMPAFCSVFVVATLLMDLLFKS